MVNRMDMYLLYDLERADNIAIIMTRDPDLIEKLLIEYMIEMELDVEGITFDHEGMEASNNEGEMVLDWGLEAIEFRSE